MKLNSEKSVTAASPCSGVLSQLSQGSRGQRSDGNVDSSGGGREGLFEESTEDTAHLLGSITPAVAE